MQAEPGSPETELDIHLNHRSTRWPRPLRKLIWEYVSVPNERSYWLDLFTDQTWREFLEAGGEVSGFSASRWNMVQRIRPGDYLLCYLTGISRWIGVLEVVGDPFKDESKIWSEWNFPSRLKVRVVAGLTPETAVPVVDMWDTLSVFADVKNPNRWSGPFRASPAKWKRQDGEAVVAAVLDAESHPVKRPVDPRKLAHRPKALRSSVGAVTLPEDDESAEPVADDREVSEVSKEPTVHTEVQFQLLKLGADMGLKVWVARNDKNREWRGKPFSELPSLMPSLPHQFDLVTNRIIEMIDVLWLSGPAIVAAFEIESTTSIYSGLLRMSDLLALQPNLNIPLFLVAPEDRRSKVISEINRPTFSQLNPPLVDVCRYISFESLSAKVSEVAQFVRYLKPDFLQEISESCEVESE
jgi:hypothetical protein